MSGYVTDPELLKQLNGGGGYVTDPALLAQLEGKPAKPKGPTQAEIDAVNPSNDMNWAEKQALGASHGLQTMWQGIRGLPQSLVPGLSDETRAKFGGQTPEEAERERLYQKFHPGINATTADIATNVIGAAGSGPGALRAAATSYATTPTDRLQSAALGGVGAKVVGALPNAVARLVRPTDLGPDAQLLNKAGVKPTFGQVLAEKADQAAGTLKGGIQRGISRIEEGMQSLPLSGAKLRGTRQANKEAWQGATREAALPPGAPAREAESIDSVRQAYSTAYKDALGDTPLPRTVLAYQPDVAVMRKGKRVSPEDAQAAADLFNEIRTMHIDAGGATATAAHAAESEMKALARGATRSLDVGEQHLGRLYNEMAHDYGIAWRNSLAPDARKAVHAIDQQYKQFLPVREAGKSVAPGVSNAVPENYTPSVLLRSARKMDTSPVKTNYLAGEQPQQPLAAAGQRVLGDKVPDSGTPERLAAMAPWFAGGDVLGNIGTMGGGLAAGTAYGSRPVQNWLTGQIGTGANQAALAEFLRRGNPYAEQFGRAAFTGD